MVCTDRRFSRFFSKIQDINLNKVTGSGLSSLEISFIMIIKKIPFTQKKSVYQSPKFEGKTKPNVFVFSGKN